MSKILMIISKVLPFLPGLFDLVMKVINAFSGKSSKNISTSAENEVKSLAAKAESLKAQEDAEWAIVKEKKDADG